MENQSLIYAKENFSKFLEDLKTLSRIPSVSFKGFPPEEVENSALATLKILEKGGFKNLEIIKMAGVHPYVYGEILDSPGAPVLLLYAHHDVQPPMREELWKSPPFEPTERDGRLYGRGTADDKAGIIVHSAAVESLLKTTGKLPVNLKIIIEGEEECGSTHLFQFLSTYKEKLQADAIVLTDCANFDTGVPALTTSLRGICAYDIVVSSLDHPLHSGMWGGPIPDPAMALMKMLSPFSNDKGEFVCPGATEGILPPNPSELESFNSLGWTEELFRSQSEMLTGVQIIGGSGGIPEKVWRKPSFTVNSFSAGDPVNAGNVILSEARARFSVRIVPGMDPEKVSQSVRKQLEKSAPWGVKWELIEEAGCGAWVGDVSAHPEAFQLAMEAFTEAYGRNTVLIGCGGSIPFVEPFSQALGGVPALLVGVEDPYTNAHGENESLHLEDFQKAIWGEILLMEKLGSRWGKNKKWKTPS